ncbi:MAG: Fe-S cluster assembly protein SufD [Pisciglobus halotolerans]|nr:Fe-S cluster assembly protein SufD [Pisciglobus halotolerans]
MEQNKRHTSQEAITAFSKSHGEPEWMLKLRQEALNKIEELDLPIIERAQFGRWPLLESKDAFPEVTTRYTNEMTLQTDFTENQAYMIQYGQQTVKWYLPKSYEEKGVIFTDIFTALKDHPELVKKGYMSQAVKMTEDKLTAFHTAFMNTGLFLYVPEKVVLEEPFEVHHIQNSRIKETFVKHVLIYAAADSSFSYVEKFQTIGHEKNAANIIIEVIAEPGSKVNFSAVDQLGKETTAYFNRRGHLLGNARVDWALGVMNNGHLIADFDTDLMGEGAYSDIKIVAVSMGRQVQAIDTRVTNYGRHSVGHILQHGVIRERATLTFNGIGHILKGAKGADAQQESRILMLSDKARGDANPILLIDENDVTAGHAASVGRVDPEEMYYLMSRGISKEEAERLVIRGFLGSVIAAIPLKTVREDLIETIERKLIE